MNLLLILYCSGYLLQIEWGRKIRPAALLNALIPLYIGYITICINRSEDNRLLGKNIQCPHESPF